MEPRSLRVAGADGLELHALEWSTENVPMVLIHGFGNEAHIWDDFAPSVAGCYRVLAIDLRGHGDSDHDPEGRYDYEDHVADFEALVEGLRFERLVLVGHSFGGRVATFYAARHPERMAGLVIVDSAPELDRRGIVRIQTEVAANLEPSFSSPRQFENLLVHNYPGATFEAIRRMARHGLKQRPDGRYALKMDTRLRAGNPRSRSAEQLAAHEHKTTAALWSALASITCPTLVVRGAASDLVSADVAEKMATQVLQRGHLAVVPRAGHSVMIDNPAGFRDAVAAFALGEQ